MKALSRWCVSLEGHEFDLQDWKFELPKPYDPYVDSVTLIDGRTRTALFVADFDACDSPEQVRTAALALIPVLSSLVQVKHPKAQVVTLGPIHERQADGKWNQSVIITPGTGVIRSRSSALGASTEPPRQTAVQRALPSLVGDLREALEHFYRADDWYELYKAWEAVRAAVSSQGLTKLGFTKRQQSDVTETINHYRHHKPTTSAILTFEDAKQWVAKMIDAALPK